MAKRKTDEEAAAEPQVQSASLSPIASPADLRAASEPEPEPEPETIPAASLVGPRPNRVRASAVLADLGFAMPLDRTLMGPFPRDDRWSLIGSGEARDAKVELWSKPAETLPGRPVLPAMYRLVVQAPGNPDVSLEVTAAEADALQKALLAKA